MYSLTSALQRQKIVLIILSTQLKLFLTHKNILCLTAAAKKRDF